ncbi:hypothetical protein TNCV_2346581 [Trichonephila clavipes]|nr:hypothetical protein TNCV_2346581 [Trichonephila clavipes]
MEEIHTKFKNHTFPDIHTPEDIDMQIAAFTDKLLQAYNNASKPLKNNHTFYISGDLKQLFKDRNRARKTWRYTRSPADKNTLNILQKKIKKIIQNYDQKQWDEALACLEAEVEAKIAYSDANKSEVIADSLQNQFKLNITNDTDRAIPHVVHTYLSNENNFTDIPIHDNTILCMFADNTAILATQIEPKLIARALNRHILDFEDWFFKWKIALNVAKTEAVFFTKKKIPGLSKNVLTQRTNYLVSAHQLPWCGS